MDLVILVLVIALIGFLIYLITTKIPMPPYWATAIQILALIVVVLYLLSRFGASLPNVMGR
jgi:flagellar biogenesis protein FliO